MTETDEAAALAARKLQLKIGGMACSFCASSITRALTRMDGVLQASVSLAHEEALVEYDPSRVSEGQIRQTLLELGYTIRDPRKVKAYEEQEKEMRLERRRLVVALGFTVLSLLEMAAAWLRVGPRSVLQSQMELVLPLVALATVLAPGGHILRMAYHTLRRGILNQRVLLELGAFSALVGGADWGSWGAWPTSRPSDSRRRTSSPWPRSSPPTTCCRAPPPCTVFPHLGAHGSTVVAVVPVGTTRHVVLEASRPGTYPYHCNLNNVLLYFGVLVAR